MKCIIQHLILITFSAHIFRIPSHHNDYTSYEGYVHRQTITLGNEFLGPQI